MNLIVVYPGRFHPFHLGHKASYDYLSKLYGEQNVRVATSDVQAPMTSPFSFSDKVAMMTKLGIPASHVVKVKNPYQVKEITDSVPEPENTALIYAVSQKDMGENPRFKFGTKKNGEPSYLQPAPDNLKKLKPLTKHAYVVITPTVNFKVQGADADSASQIRKLYMNSNEQDRTNIITDLYGAPDATLQDIFDKKLGITQKVTELYLEARTNKNVAVLEKLLILEQQANHQQYNITQDPADSPDYLDEKK